MKEVLVNTRPVLSTYAHRAGHRVGNIRTVQGKTVVDLDGKPFAASAVWQFLRDHYTFRHMDGRIMKF